MKTLFGIVLVLLVGVGLVIKFVLPEKAPAPESAMPTSAPVEASQPQTVQTTPAASPKMVYLKMRGEIDGVATYAEYEAVIMKYGSKAQIAAIESKRAQINALPTSFKDQLVAVAKNPPSNQITITQENISGNTAALSMTSSQAGMKGTATLVKENNQWKIDSETWTQQ